MIFITRKATEYSRPTGREAPTCHITHGDFYFRIKNEIGQVSSIYWIHNAIAGRKARTGSDMTNAFWWVLDFAGLALANPSGISIWINRWKAIRAEFWGFCGGFACIGICNFLLFSSYLECKKAIPQGHIPASIGLYQISRVPRLHKTFQKSSLKRASRLHRQNQDRR